MSAPDVPCLIPLAVAVTGHRDIDPFHEDTLRALAAEKFLKFQKTYPNTPIRCLSGLNEGADMIFAEAALDVGLELIAVLPAKPEEYSKAFKTPAHAKRDPTEIVQRFQALLEKCEEVVIVPAPEQDTQGDSW